MQAETLEARTVLTASFVGSPIPAQFTLEDTPHVVEFQIADDTVPLTSLTVTATSLSQTLFPDAHLALADLGDGHYRLTSTPAANQGGAATAIRLTITGDGTPVEQSFALTVTAVNDAPSFTKGADQTIVHTAGAQTVAGWATNISQGPNEPTQTVSFQVTNDNPTLFSVQPTISPTGTLNYTPSGVLGTANISVVLTDDGGTADGGVNASPAQTFTITSYMPILDAGDLDPTFDGDGVMTITSPLGAYDQGRDVAVQADGKLLVLSYTYTGGFRTGGISSFATTNLTRYNADGTVDTTFGTGGTFTLADQYRLTAVEVLSGGKILLAGDTTVGSGIYVTRLNSTGGVDTTFGSSGSVTLNIGNISIAPTDVVAMAVQSDERIVLARGYRTVVAGNMHFAVARLTASGAADTTFNGTGVSKVTVSSSQNEFPTDVAVQADGKIVVGGVTNLGAGSFNDFIALRFTSTGALDTTFNGTGYHVVNVSSSGSGSDTANRVLVQSDGKIVVAGNATGDFGLVRFNADGSLDTTFDGDGKVTTHFSGTDQIFGLDQQADGMLVAGGVAGGASNDFALARYTAAGALDTTFDGDGKATFAVSTNNEQINALALQADGKIVFAGISTDSVNAGDAVVGRFNTSGSIDTTFNGGGYASKGTTPGSGRITSSLQISDGTVLLGGFLVEQNTPNAGRRAVWRLLADGTLDTSFGTGGVSLGTALTQTVVSSLTLQSDGKILFVDSVQSRLTRLHSNGSLDTSFGGGTVSLAPTYFTTPAGASAIALQSDGKILVVGSKLNSGTSLNELAVVRVTSAGVVDTTFDGDGLVTIDVGAGADFGKDIAIQSDGKILLGGYGGNGANNDFALVRLNADGSLDTTFAGTGKVLKAVGSGTDQARTILLQSDGKIVLAGQATNDFGLVRFLSDGTTDGSFGTAGVVMTAITAGLDEVVSLQRQSDGKYLAVGFVTVGNVTNIAVARYLTDGGLDSTFGTGGVVNTLVAANANQAFTSYLQPDGQLVVGGYSDGSSVAYPTLLRYVTDTVGGGPAITPIADQAMLEDGTAASIDFSVSHTSLPAGSLTVAASSGDTGLIPNANLVLIDLGNGNWRLTATPAANQFGSALITVTASDGATFYAGTFTLTVTPVNDAPSFTKGADQSILHTAGPQTVAGWATGISAGSNEAGQTLTFEVENDNPALFSIAPTIAADGTLSYTPSGILGTATITVFLRDDGGTSSGGADHSVSQTFEINVAASATSVSAGSLDPTFVGDGILTLPSVIGSFDVLRDVAVQSDGKYVVVGLTNAATFQRSRIARFNADGSLDTTFGTAGFVTDNNRLFSVQVLADGKIVVGGDAPINLYTARYNSDGTLDTSFGKNGSNTINYGNSSGSSTQTAAMAIGPDGSIVITRVSASSNGHIAVGRFTSSGDIDTTFNGTGFVIHTLNGARTETPNGIAVQSDGKIVIVGSSASSTSISDWFAIRLNLNGSLDGTFGSGGVVTTHLSASGSVFDSAQRVHVQSDGKLVIGGTAGADFGLVRLNSDGGFDTSLNASGKLVTNVNATDAAYAMGVQADGKIILAGSATGAGSDIAFVRFNGNGTLDTTFGTSGKKVIAGGIMNDVVNGLLVASDGTIVFVGQYDDGQNGGDFCIGRLLGDGALDTTFGTTGIVKHDMGPSAAWGGAALTLEDGRTLIAGQFTEGTNVSLGRRAFWMLNADGTPDTTFGSDGLVIGPSGFSSQVTSLLRQPDGKFLFIDNGTYKSIGRLNADGSIDASFGSGGIRFLYSQFIQLYDMKLLDDGSIIAVGTKVGGTDVVVARLTSSGNLDTSFDGDGIAMFNVGPGNDIGRAVAIQSDGKIVVAGSSSTGGVDDFLLMRLHSNGTLDTTFGGTGSVVYSATSGHDRIHSLLLLADGKFVVAGTANNDYTVARFRSDGALDASFGNGGTVTTNITGSIETYSRLLQQTDGKLLAIGLDSPGLVAVRFSADGDYDSAFSGDGIARINSNATNTLVPPGAALTADGKLVIAAALGNGTTYDLGVVRLLTEELQPGTPQVQVFDTTIAEDVATPIDFTVSHSTIPAGSLTVTVASDNTSVVPDENLTLTNLGGGQWRLTAQSAPNVVGSALITVTVSDGTLNYADTFTLTVTAVNDAPFVDLNGPSAGSGYSTTFMEDGVALLAVDAVNLAVGDVDSDTLAGATIAITNRLDGAAETLSADVTGTPISASYDAGVLTLGGVATVAEYRQVLATVRYRNTSQSPTPADRQISFTVTDGTATSPAAVTTVTITPVNDAPTAGVNTGRTLAEGATVVIDGTHLRTDDVDNSASQRVYTLTALTIHGALTLDGVALSVGGTFTQADLDSGKVAYAHDSTENFSDSFKFTVSDGQYTLPEATFGLTITPVNDAPTAGLNTGRTLAEGATVAIDGTHLRTDDTDNATDQRIYTLTALTAYGALTLDGVALTAGGTFTQADLDSGKVAYAHDSTENFTDSFRFTVSDGEYTLPEATFGLTITPVNDALTPGLNTGRTLAEGATVVIDGTQLRTDDVDNSASQRVYILTALTIHGALTLDGVALSVGGTFTQADLDSGKLSYTHDSSENFTDSFKFTVGDGEFTLPEATFGLTITPVNDAPTAGLNTGRTLAEGATIVIDGTHLRTDDVDNATAQRIYTLTALTAHGALMLDGVTLNIGGSFTQADLDTGKVTYVHNSTENFADSFKFTVSDGEFTLPEATFGLTITPVNDALTAGVNTGRTLDEGATVVVDGTQLRTDDVDNSASQRVYILTALTAHGALRLDGVALNVGGTFTQADLDSGKVSYAHDSTENFADSFRFTVSDGEYTLPEATFGLTITPVNDAPTAGLNTGRTLAEGATVVIDGTQLRTDDVDNSTAQRVYTLTALTAHGVLKLAGTTLSVGGTFTQADLDSGKVTYVHNSTENFTDSFKFTVSDGQYTLPEATFGLMITPVNDAPTAGLNTGRTLTEGATVVIDGTHLRTDDVDNSASQRVYTLTALTIHGALTLDGVALGVGGTFTQADLDSGKLTYVHNSTENFTDSFKFTVSDGQYTLPEATFGLTITPVNDAPTAGLNTGLTLNEGATVVIDGTQLRTDDVDNSAAQRVYTLTALTAHGALTLDGVTLSVGGTFTQADLDSGKVTYVHNSTENFTDSFKFTVSDGQYTLPEATFGLTITPVNDAPTASVNAGGTLPEGGTVVLAGAWLRTDDVDDTAADLAYTVTALPAHGRLFVNFEIAAVGARFTQAELDAGRILYNHDSGENFADGFRFTVSDGEFTLPEATFGLTITPVNDALTAGLNTGRTLAEGATVVIDGTQLRTDDADNSTDQRIYTLTALAAHGVLKLDGTSLGLGGAFTQADLDTGKLSYTHDSSENFTDEFKFTVSDGEFTLPEATFALSITTINDAPTAALNTGLTLDEGATVVIDGTQLRTDDADHAPAASVYTLTALTTHGALTLDGEALSVGGTFTQADLDSGKVSYAHDSTENFADSFRFTVSDGEYTLPEATFGLTIAPVNDAPVVAPQAFILYGKAPPGTIVGTVQASDRDAGQSRTFRLVGDNGALTINAVTGTLTVVNSKLLVGTALQFIVRVTDDGDPSLSTDAPITVQLRPSDTPPGFSVADSVGTSVAVIKNRATLLVDESTDVTATVNGLLLATLASTDFDEPGVFLPLTMTDKSGAFAFDPTTGRLTVADAAKLNFEKTKSFDLVFQATDHGLIGLPKPVTGTLTLTVKLVDRNDAPTTAPTATFKLKENNAARATVGTVVAKDEDPTAQFKTLGYTIVSQRDAAGDDVSLFAIDAKGKITLPAAGALNYEASPVYTLIVRVADGGGLFREQTVTVQVIDVNEPVVLTLLDAAQNPTAGLSVAENTPAGTLVGYVRVDNPDTARAETYKLTLSDTLGKAFAVGAVDPTTRLAAITVVNPTKLNFEAVRDGRFSLNFTIADSGFISDDGSKQGAVTAKRTFVNQVLDVNEGPTVLNWKAAKLPGGGLPIPAGTLFGTASTVDPDKVPQAFTYALVAGAGNNDLFVIDAATGQLRSSVALGRKGIFTLLLRTTDQGGLALERLLTIKT